MTQRNIPPTKPEYPLSLSGTFAATGGDILGPGPSFADAPPDSLTELRTALVFLDETVPDQEVAPWQATPTDTTDRARLDLAKRNLLHAASRVVGYAALNRLIELYPQEETQTNAGDSASDQSPLAPDEYPHRQIAERWSSIWPSVMPPSFPLAGNSGAEYGTQGREDSLGDSAQIPEGTPVTAEEDFIQGLESALANPEYEHGYEVGKEQERNEENEENKRIKRTKIVLPGGRKWLGLSLKQREGLASIVASSMERALGSSHDRDEAARSEEDINPDVYKAAFDIVRPLAQRIEMIAFRHNGPPRGFTDLPEQFDSRGLGEV